MFALSIDTVNMPAVLAANGLGAWLMCILLLEKRRRIHRARKEIRIFHAMCRMCLALCLLETLSFHLDGLLFPGARPLCLLINASLFMMNAIFAYLFLWYISHKLFKDHPLLRRLRPWAALPAGIICAMSLANLFTDVFFRITAENLYYRTPLAWVSYLVTYLYLMAGAGMTHYYHRRINRTRTMPVGIFLLPVFVGSALQYCFYGIALIWPSVAVGLTAMHISLQNEESTLDSLTGVYNRNYLIHYWDYVAMRTRQGHQLTGILLDINEFKQINDTYGHRVGDRVLCDVSEVLKHSIGPDTLLARYGGDEFVMLTEDSSPELLQETRNRILTGIEEYNASGRSPCFVSLSIGVAELKNASLSELFNRMDHNMYLDKKKFHHQQDEAHHPREKDSVS